VHGKPNRQVLPESAADRAPTTALIFDIAAGPRPYPGDDGLWCAGIYLLARPLHARPHQRCALLREAVRIAP